MSNTLNVLGEYFERIIRWLYPGALLLFLLHLSGKNPIEWFINQKFDGSVWLLVVFVAFVAGAVIYMLQSYVWNNLVTLVFVPFGFLDKCDEQLSGRVRKWLAGQARVWGEPAWRRWSYSRERMDGWLNYAWGSYHAAWMTLGLTVACRFVSVEDSPLYGVPVWILVLLGVVLGLFLLFYYLIFTRLTLRMPLTNDLKCETNKK